MKIIKKLLGLGLIAGAALLTLTACSKDQPESTDLDSTTKKSETTKDSTTVPTVESTSISTSELPESKSNQNFDDIVIPFYTKQSSINNNSGKYSNIDGIYYIQEEKYKIKIEDGYVTFSWIENRTVKYERLAENLVRWQRDEGAYDWLFVYEGGLLWFGKRDMKYYVKIEE